MTTRAFRAQADADIVDRAAALFAQRGFAKTSVQDIADAVVLSKAGLLHHFPSKEALRAAVFSRAASLEAQAVEAIGDVPTGPSRDARALEVLVDLALAHPGLVALLLSPVGHGPAEGPDEEIHRIGDRVIALFGVDPAAAVTERTVRVLGALAALALLTLAATEHDQAITWRPLILTTCLDTLGRRSPGVHPSDPHQLEA
ncbi:TetR/AcrR family transcriptional regulator [Nakamurella flavida]|uniref:TetR/AcrR family transcriptional regulator n=1 Tax=Nakamurella flavida TaxID=363630 RepID=A0A938YII7_9ACTN|nr:TetR/AcrR family transcriptional regulator [Nakamurella flavida]MBM9475241.1 TetR/AcrR family transcriptional regulator [Nakamurella flavida]MDP9776814.1 AcrR family transcriptional regulator [Nakamurella flavida]